MMMRRITRVKPWVWIVLILTLGVLNLVFLRPSYGQAMCGPRAEILRALNSRYQEAPVAQGVMNSGTGVLEIIAHPNGKTWTALVTRPDGHSCVVASGEDFSILSYGRDG